MLTLSHYRFRCVLEHMCWKNGKKLIICNEAYTSKTHPITGELIANLGSKEVIKTVLGEVDRDINGARNILLRALGNAPSIAKLQESALTNCMV